MKLLYAEQMKDIDRQASENYLIPSLLLMENAGLQVLDTVNSIIGHLPRARVTILSGKGNNGGDGLVLGRHLINAGAAVDIFLLGDSGHLTHDAQVNYLILEKMKASVYPLKREQNFDRLVTNLLSSDLIVDAIYGIGFRGSLNDFETRVAEMVNLSKVPVLAVDIASGVEANTGMVHGSAIKADYTVTFARPKLGQYLEPGQSYSGKLIIAAISIPVPLLEHEGLKLNLIDQEMVSQFIKPRQAESHKGSYGHVLVTGGSTGMTGAVIMASCAALRSGAGLVTAALPESLVPILEASSLEVMSRPLSETREGGIAGDALSALKNLLETVSVCAIGPGMSRYPEANAVIRFVLENSRVPVLVDADGLNALAGDVEIFKNLQVPVVITPHPGEMSRLTGLTVGEIQSNRLEIAHKYAADWGITVVLKGNKTVVAGPSGDIFINTSGNPGMATAGSGDVLSGIIVGLVAQGLNPQQAAVAGVYIHGCCGDKAAATGGERGLIAGDLIDQLPYVLKELENANKD
jgi:yjeF C-terminal region, hydroxyethylthiazole kinase-related/yjeF N-terminal region